MGEYTHDDGDKQQGHKHESKPQQRKRNKQPGQGAFGNGIVDLSHLSDDERSRYLIKLMQGSIAGSRESELLHMMQNSNSGPKERVSSSSTATGYPNIDLLRELVVAENSLMGNFTDFPDGQAALLLSNLDHAEQQRLWLDDGLSNRLFHELNSQLTARAIAHFDLTLTEKLRWIALGESSGKVAYQYIRPLLLQEDKRAKTIEAFLSTQIGLDQDVYVDSLIKQLQATRLDLTKINTGWGILSTPVNEIKDQLDQEDFTLGDADSADRMLGIAGQKVEEINNSDKEAFLKLFEQNAVACAQALLNESEKAVQKEHSQVTEEGVGAIQAALVSQSDLFMTYEALQKEQQDTLRRARSSQEAADITQRFQKKLQTQEKHIRKALMATHPVFGDESLPFVQLYDFYKNGNRKEFQVFLQQSLGEKYENIQKTRANLRECPALIWSLEKVVQLTSRNIPLLDDPIYYELAMQEFERRKRNDTIIRSTMAALSIGLAIASFGSMSGMSAVILGGLSIGVSGIDGYMTYQEYDQIAPAGNTTFDPEKVLTDEDPAVVWVIASAAGALADGVQLVKLAKQLATLCKVNKALELQNLEKVTAKLAGKISEKELANLKNNLQLLDELRKIRQTLAHGIVKQSQGKLDLTALEEAVDIYMLQNSEELIKVAKSGSFRLTKETQEEVLGWYGMQPEGRGKLLEQFEKKAEKGKFVEEAEGVIRSFEDLFANPKSIWGKSADEVGKMLGKGWERQPLNSGEGWKFVQKDGDGFVSFTTGNSHHPNSTYYKINSGTAGKNKVVGKGYVPAKGDKSKIFYAE